MYFLVVSMEMKKTVHFWENGLQDTHDFSICYFFFQVKMVFNGKKLWQLQLSIQTKLYFDM